ncbi:H-NS histone family protein [Acidithiobacillus thiooxidans]|jgi:DNA-binding protein H-NS|uniref:Trans-acting regulatory protein HvrA n=1 Tax=Acidithiobacillus thiooxidans ATCC 19377 TaxID=637390 RepID=A0A5P9XSG1_ACITH|nr:MULTISPECIES: H-NS histone family protein [Acidithiobacillus]MBU2743220.1 H-NS histone family protein [Acidithiobacillus albertensis]MBU2793066.1 H-NS histone family protein [Acidithiobacillus thiooxidans]MBU2812345.1 H-NS histone family protein [Acidithiobacillus thiooxidans]MBU2837761.1 H-NS histone family protein [Acidithiobacillus thiooxidans]MDA8151450.1 H-NS histone family protein [Acidithiobacillus sp.]
MSILQELEAAKKAKEAADKRVEELLKQAKDEGLAEIRRIVEDLGLTAKDLLKLVPSEPQKTRRVRKSPAFWYQHPTDPNLVWKGAGPKPAWFKALSEEAQQACKKAAG